MNSLRFIGNFILSLLPDLRTNGSITQNRKLVNYSIFNKKIGMTIIILIITVYLLIRLARLMYILGNSGIITHLSIESILIPLVLTIIIEFSIVVHKIVKDFKNAYYFDLIAPQTQKKKTDSLAKFEKT